MPYPPSNDFTSILDDRPEKQSTIFEKDNHRTTHHIVIRISTQLVDPGFRTRSCLDTEVVAALLGPRLQVFNVRSA